jgi:hypothetical protein
VNKIASVPPYSQSAFGHDGLWVFANRLFANWIFSNRILAHRRRHRRGKSAALAALSTVNNPKVMLNTAMNPAELSPSVARPRASTNKGD